MQHRGDRTRDGRRSEGRQEPGRGIQHGARNVGITGKMRAVVLVSLVLLGAFVVSLRTVLADPTPSSDPATFWNQVTTRLEVAAKFNPLRIARTYALVHVAIYDALLASGRMHHGTASQIAVAAGAASEVLMYLFPAYVANIAENESAQAASADARNFGVVVSGLNFGHTVGRMVVIHGQNDGSDAIFAGPIPTGDCIWSGTKPLEATMGGWETWILTSGAEVQPRAPYACGSEADLADVQAVIDAHNGLTPDQIAIVHKWGDVTAPIIWNGVLNQQIESHGLSALQSAQAHAYMNIAIYDGLVATWLAKFTYWTARPFMRIPGFTTVIPTPNFPSYVSAHSVVSAGSSMVLGEFFPELADHFAAQAEEAAMSRLWGGIHFQQDDDQGLVMGRAVGAKVVQDMQSAPHTFVFPISPEGLA